MRTPASIRPLPWVLAILAVATILRGHALWTGFAMDDYAQLAMLGDAYPVARAPWDLFSFCDGSPAELARLRDAGVFPWWSDPELRLSTLRPVASLTTWLDVRVFGPDPRPAHVHTLVWWIVMLVVVSRLLLRVLPTRWALVALALYALDECHAQPLAWLANRNAILVTVFGIAAVDAHVRWREAGAPRSRAGSVVAMAVAFACGEAALAGVAFIVAYEIAQGRRARWVSTWPLAVVVIAWAVVHTAWGYGASFSGIYVDPLAEPLAWAAAAVERGPILAADLVFATPTGLLALGGRGLLAQQLVGVVALAVGALWLRRMAARGSGERLARLRWFAWAAVLALVPMVSAFVSARLLVMPAIAAHVVLAAAILDGVDAGTATGWAARARMALAAVLLVAHGILAPWWCAREISDLRTFSAAVDRAARDAPIRPGDRVVVLAVVDPATLLYPQLIRALDRRPPPASWIVLSASPGRHRLTRLDRHTLELEIPGGMLRSHVEQMFRRADRLPRTGETITLDEVTAEVRDVDAEGAPTRVRFGFTVPLDDPSWAFLLATPAGFVRYPLGPSGVAVDLPPAAAPR